MTSSVSEEDGKTYLKFDGTEVFRIYDKEFTAAPIGEYWSSSSDNYGWEFSVNFEPSFVSWSVSSNASDCGRSVRLVRYTTGN